MLIEGSYKLDDYNPKEDKMPDQLKELTKFYKEHYQPLMVKDDIIYYDKLSYILAYEAIDMITNINNNIQEHFIDHLNKYVNINLKNHHQLRHLKNIKQIFSLVFMPFKLSCISRQFKYWSHSSIMLKPKISSDFWV